MQYNVVLKNPILQRTYFYGFIQGSHPDAPKYAPLEIQPNITNHDHAKNNFGFMPGDIFYFSGAFASGGISANILIGSTVSLYVNL